MIEYNAVSTDQDMLAFLKKYGYLADKELKDLYDAQSVGALARYIEFNGLDPYTDGPSVLNLDGRGIDLSVIRNQMNQPRCGMADFGPDVETLNGSGSWRVGCHSDWPKNHCVKLKFDFSGRPSWWGPVWDQSWSLVRQAYADIGIVLVEAKSGDQVNIDVSWQRGSGWIGLAIVGRNQTCSTRIWAKFDNRYRPGDLVNMLARLMAHEFGHNMGLGHSRGGIMNPSITSGIFSPTSWRGDPSFPTLARWFGGKPVNIGQPPTDPPKDPVEPVEGVINSGRVFLSNGSTYVLASPTDGTAKARLYLPDGKLFTGSVALADGTKLS